MNKESAIQYLIYKHHNNGIVLPNIHTDVYGGSEVDAMYLTNTNRAYFYEIKCSKSDFKNDFKKKRHKLLLRRSEAVNIKPKYFYYVCYGFSINIEEIPEYAGLILCDKNGLQVYPVAKKAPLLWKEPLTASNLAFINKKILYRYLNNKYLDGYEDWKIIMNEENKKEKRINYDLF